MAGAEQTLGKRDLSSEIPDNLPSTDDEAPILQANLAIRPRESVIESAAQHPIFAAAGFSPDFPDRIRSLNNVLSTILPSEPRGFNLSLRPDAISPDIRFTTNVDRHFHVEVMGTERGRAAVQIGVDVESPDTSLSLSSIQEFTRAAFSGREVRLHAEPKMHYRGRNLRTPPPARKAPEDFSGWQQDKEWKRWWEEYLKGDTEDMLRDLLPDYDRDLYEVSDMTIDGFVDPVHRIQIDVKFLNMPRPDLKRYQVVHKGRLSVPRNEQIYDKFNVVLDGQEDPLLVFRLATFEDPFPRKFFHKLFFEGKSDEVENVIDHATVLFQQTEGYEKRKVAE